MQKSNLMKVYPEASPTWWSGAAHGFGLALRTLYPNAEAFIKEDPAAAQLILTALAIEECARQ